MKNKLIVVWFSCGVASAVSAKMIIDKYGNDNNILIINMPIKEEHPDNIRFLYSVQKWLKHPILSVVNNRIPSQSIYEVFEKTRYMSGVNGAACTKQLKKDVRYQIEKSINIDYHVLGFTFDEIKRHERFIKYERDNIIPILIDEKITKGRCFEIINEAKIKLPEIYKIGLPNANCIGCVKSQSPTYWNLIRNKFPEVFNERSEQSRRLGVKLVKLHGDRIYLDELKESDKGGKIKTFDCGIFCDNY